MPERGKQARWDYAAAVLLTVVPILSHLRYQDFPLRSLDAVGLIAPYLALGVVLGWLVQRMPGWARKTTVGLLTAAFVDLAFAPETIMPVPVVVGIVVLLAWLLWEHYTKIVTVTVAAVLVAVPFRQVPLAKHRWQAPSSPGAASASSLVPIVHIILDEHAAPRAFPADIPEAVQARDRVRAFYQRHGFRLFENAYSRYFFSRSSIPATLAPLSEEEVLTKVVQLDAHHFRVTDNPLFRQASDRGYRIHVVQSSYLDMCGLARDVIASCRTYPHNSLVSLGDLQVNLFQRLRLEHWYFLTVESSLVRQGQRAVFRRFKVDAARAGTVLAEMGQLQTELRGNLEGSFHFAHFLFPHSPFELDAACQPVSLVNRVSPRWTNGQIWDNSVVDGWRVRWRIYSGQVECLYTHLDSLIAAIDSAAPPQGVRIIIHGDHGSRIVRAPPYPARAALVSNEDLIDGFATLLAVRGPGVPPGSDSSAVAIQDIVPRLVVGSTSLALLPADSVPFVILQRQGRWTAPVARLPAPALAR